jgi:hypothetical protein
LDHAIFSHRGAGRGHAPKRTSPKISEPMFPNSYFWNMLFLVIVGQEADMRQNAQVLTFRTHVSEQLILELFYFWNASANFGT